MRLPAVPAALLLGAVLLAQAGAQPPSPAPEPVPDPGVTLLGGVGPATLRRCVSLDRLKQTFDVKILFAFTTSKAGIEAPPKERRNTIHAVISCETRAFPDGVRSAATIDSIEFKVADAPPEQQAKLDSMGAGLAGTVLRIRRANNAQLDIEPQLPDDASKDSQVAMRLLTDALRPSMPRLPANPFPASGEWEVRAHGDLFAHPADHLAHNNLVIWYDGGRIFVNTKVDESGKEGEGDEHAEVTRHIEGYSIFFPADILPRECKQSLAVRLLDPGAAGKETPVYQEWMDTDISIVSEEPPPEMNHLALRLQDLFLASTQENPGSAGDGITVQIPAPPEGAPPQSRWTPGADSGTYEFTWRRIKHKEFAGGLPLPWAFGSDWNATLSIDAAPGAGATVITAHVTASSLGEELLPSTSTIRFTLSDTGRVSDLRITGFERWRTRTVWASRVIAHALAHCFAPMPAGADATKGPWDADAQGTVIGLPVRVAAHHEFKTIEGGRMLVSKLRPAPGEDAAPAPLAEFNDGRLTLHSFRCIDDANVTFAGTGLLPARAAFDLEDNIQAEVSCTSEFSDTPLTWPVLVESEATVTLSRRP